MIIYYSDQFPEVKDAVLRAYYSRRRKIHMWYRISPSQIATIDKVTKLVMHLRADPELFMDAQFDTSLRGFVGIALPAELLTDDAVERYRTFMARRQDPEFVNKKLQEDLVEFTRRAQGRTEASVLADPNLAISPLFRYVYGKTYGVPVEDWREEAEETVRKYPLFRQAYGPELDAALGQAVGYA